MEAAQRCSSPYVFAETGFGTEEGSRTKITNSPTGNCHANKTPTSLPYQSHPQRYVRDDRRNLRASAYQEPPFAIRSAKRGVASKTGIHHDAGQLRHRSRRNIYYSMASSTSIVRIDKIPFGVRGLGRGSRESMHALQVAHCHGRLSPICCPRGSDKCRSSTTNRLLKPHFPSFSSSSGILGRAPR